MDFQQQYSLLLSRCLNAGITETNERTGSRIKVLPGAQTLHIQTGAHLPLAGNRAYYPKSAAAELAWQLMGTRDPAFMMKYAPRLWEKFIEDGMIKAAYGFRWRKAFGRDQLGLAISALRKDPSNRQIWVQAWDPTYDGLGELGQPKNIPCPLGFGLNIVDQKLHMNVFVRSSDIFVGLPYDVMNYAFLYNAICNELHLSEYGTLSFTLSHAHLYETHWEMAKESLTWAQASSGFIIPAWSVSDIMKDPHGYVESAAIMSMDMAPHPYKPIPDVVE